MCGLFLKRYFSFSLSEYQTVRGPSLSLFMGKTLPSNWIPAWKQQQHHHHKTETVMIFNDNVFSEEYKTLKSCRQTNEKETSQTTPKNHYSSLTLFEMPPNHFQSYHHLCTYPFWFFSIFSLFSFLLVLWLFCASSMLLGRSSCVWNLENERPIWWLLPDWIYKKCRFMPSQMCCWSW